MSLRDHANERGWFGHRYQPPIAIPVKVAPVPTPPTPEPAPADPPSSEPVFAGDLLDGRLDGHDERDDIIARTPAHAYRWALMRGYGVEGAGLWAAYMAGIPLLDEPAKAWTLKQVRTLVFLRETYERWA